MSYEPPETKSKNQPEKAKTRPSRRTWLIRFALVFVIVLLGMIIAYFSIPTYKSITAQLTRQADRTEYANYRFTESAEIENGLSTAEALCQNNQCPEATSMAATINARDPFAITVTSLVATATATYLLPTWIAETQTAQSIQATQTAPSR
jgi:hypothetical protein